MKEFKSLLTPSYIACALWSSTDLDEPLDKYYSVENISAETLAQMDTDCVNFERYLEQCGLTVPESHSFKQTGHDFWLSRNGHGSGFFDSGSDPIWKKLQEAAQTFGPFDICVGDDGIIHH